MKKGISRDEEDDSSRSFLVIGRALLFFVSIGISLLLVEAGLTWVYVGSVVQGPLELVPEWKSPYVFTVREGWGANGQGVRRAEAIAEKPSRDSIRILSYGDSIADGYRLASDESYASVLERALERDAYGPVEVLNMMRGHSPTIHSFHLRVDVPRFEPQGVILQIELTNDVSDEALIVASGRDRDGLPQRLGRARYLVGWDGHLLAPLALRGSPLERTKIFAKLSRWVGRVRNRVDPNPIFSEGSDVFYYSSSADRARLTQANLDAGFERLFASIEGIRNYTAEREIRFLLLILPSKHAYESSAFRASARAAVSRAERRALELGVPFLSALDALEGEGGADLFMDFCHPTPAGNRAIAALVEPVLASWVRDLR